MCQSGPHVLIVVSGKVLHLGRVREVGHGCIQQQLRGREGHTTLKLSLASQRTCIYLHSLVLES